MTADAELPGAKQLVEKLRDVRDYEWMGRLAEAVSRIDPKDPKNRRPYAQCPIDSRHVTAAIDVLQALLRRLPNEHPEAAEAIGLLGRANKQIFFDASDKTSSGANHKGVKEGMTKLNGVAGTYAANEGIAIRSIALAAKPPAG